MTWRQIVAPFGRPPLNVLMTVSGLALSLSVLSTRNEPLLAFCGGDWAPRIWDEGPIEALQTALAFDAPATLALEWLLMLLVMTPTLLAQPLTHVWSSSRPRLRWLSIASFVVAYGSVWMLIGPILAFAAILIIASVGAAAPAVSICLALAWSATPYHQTVLNRAHRVKPLRVFGWPAVSDAFAYGWRHAEWCLLSCWAFMLVPLIWVELHLPLMVLIGAAISAERLVPPRQPRWRVPVPLSPLRTMLLTAIGWSRNSVRRTYD